MTKEEMIKLSDLIDVNYLSIDNELSGWSDEDKFRVAVLAAGIEILREDMKSIVEDAVRRSVTETVDKVLERLTPNEMRKDSPPLFPIEVFPTDDTGKHPIAIRWSAVFTQQMLQQMGIRYFEEIQGYVEDLKIQKVFLKVNGQIIGCPDTFCHLDVIDLESAMNAIGLPLKALPIDEAQE